MNKYDELIKLFIDWNSKINLSAIRDIDGIKVKHIQDSLVGDKIIKNLIKGNNEVIICDVGSGSGFPLLPLVIENPHWQFVSIESVKKKVNAIKNMAEKLGLKNIKFIWDRAENIKDLQCDILTARAVAYIDKLMKFTYHLVKPGGYFVLYKLKSEEEFKDLQKVIKKYNLSLELAHEYKLFPEDITRVIYVLKKH